VADFEIIEADFQQFYNLDVSTLGFRRYARLLVNLPEDSRMVKKYSPFKDWNWDKEMQSQILRAVDTMTTTYINSNRKKGSKKLKPPELVQPDYVKKAKKKLGEEQKIKAREKQEELAEFFRKRNQIDDKIKERKNGT